MFSWNSQFNKTKMMHERALTFALYYIITHEHGSRTIIDVRNEVTHKIFNTKW